MKQLQQGDVLIKKLDYLPKGINKITADKRGLVLAEGEHTGHFHAIVAEEGVELYEHEGTLFLHTEKEVELTHQEHNTVTIAPGDYEIGRVREMDYTKMMTRPVAD